MIFNRRLYLVGFLIFGGWLPGLCFPVSACGSFRSSAVLLQFIWQVSLPAVLFPVNPNCFNGGSQ